LSNAVLSPGERDRIDAALATVEALEPPIVDLGTPQLDLTPELEEIVALGPRVVPHLLDRLRSASPKMAAYLALILRHVDDPAAVEGLRELKDRFEALPEKYEWHFAAIGQCREALEPS
jgi:hypothetical protein